MVLIAHLTGGFYLHSGQPYSEATQRIITSIGAFGVEIFFILSGYVIFIAAKKSTSSNFFKNRFWRIYPLFCALTIVYFTGNLILNLEPEKNNIVYLLINLMFLDRFFDTPAMTPNAWSLTFEIWYYFVTYIFVSSYFSRKATIWLLPAFGVFAFFFCVYPITFYFVLGVTLAMIQKTDFKLKIPDSSLPAIQLTSLAGIITLCTLDIEFASEGWEGLIQNPIEFLLPILLLVFMATLITGSLPISRLLTKKPVLFLGNISYSLYLVHPYTYLVSRKVIDLLPITNTYSVFACFMMLSVSISILIAYLVNRFFENMIFNYAVHKNIYR
ncbi:Uncharacterised protein [BD1-7 clade bacterium]|uniref:Acyltransferase 3 domain-containing protein n=1 Tax=BD1-7 clade bacterium TaxID=2029982 RepID=A0A5S9QR99_9GAMM|nr:Uncharacterised protein [BD1-7 clade bacterium]CAA0121473.1 Uncharacterised protein [BD1-7 clade bacterium]